MLLNLKWFEKLFSPKSRCHTNDQSVPKAILGMQDTIANRMNKSNRRFLRIVSNSGVNVSSLKFIHFAAPKRDTKYKRPKKTINHADMCGYIVYCVLKGKYQSVYISIRRRGCKVVDQPITCRQG